MNILESVNKEVNLKIRYLPDKKDYWQTPDETLSLGTGDCEDYAILKYFILADRGFPEEHLRLSYCKYRGEAHLTLLAYENEDWYVLDNNYRSVYRLAEMPIKELFRFTRECMWIVHDNEEILTDQNPIERLSKWAQIVERIKHNA